MEEKEIMKQNKMDTLALTAKSIVGVAPFVGPLLSELVGNLIPNQRLDRLTKYAIELDARLRKFEEDELKNKLKDETFSDLLEQSLIDASRALSDERRRYIASIIENSLNPDHIKSSEAKYLLQLLNELNDIEVIWLRYFLSNHFAGDEEFRKQHTAILTPISIDSGSGQEEREKAALQTSYKEHLERLGLIKANYNFNRTTNLPEYDSFTGKPKITYYEMTGLGRLLLKYIGLME
jgi:hypothetical protein